MLVVYIMTLVSVMNVLDGLGYKICSRRDVDVVVVGNVRSYIPQLVTYWDHVAQF